MRAALYVPIRLVRSGSGDVTVVDLAAGHNQVPVALGQGTKAGIDVDFHTYGE